MSCFHTMGVSNRPYIPTKSAGMYTSVRLAANAGHKLRPTYSQCDATLLTLSIFKNGASGAKSVIYNNCPVVVCHSMHIFSAPIGVNVYIWVIVEVRVELGPSATSEMVYSYRSSLTTGHRAPVDIRETAAWQLTHRNVACRHI